MNQIIEVKLIKKKVNYVATASLFPMCKGIGKTKHQALDKLATSISSFISSIIKSTLSDLFQSNRYTHVLMDHVATNPGQVMAFNLNQTQLGNQKSFMFRVASIEGTNDIEADLDNSSDIFQKGFDDTDAASEILEQLLNGDKSSHDSDEITFGFPLNFN